MSGFDMILSPDAAALLVSVRAKLASLPPGDPARREMQTAIEQIQTGARLFNHNVIAALHVALGDT